MIIILAACWSRFRSSTVQAAPRGAESGAWETGRSELENLRTDAGKPRWSLSAGSHRQDQRLIVLGSDPPSTRRNRTEYASPERVFRRYDSGGRHHPRRSA